jgi:hypothetical protein
MHSIITNLADAQIYAYTHKGVLLVSDIVIATAMCDTCNPTPP